jgi:hypothetical protein
LENEERTSVLLVDATPIARLWSAAGYTVSILPSLPADVAQTRADWLAVLSADSSSAEYVVKSKLMLMTFAPFCTA